METTAELVPSKGVEKDELETARESNTPKLHITTVEALLRVYVSQNKSITVPINVRVEQLFIRSDSEHEHINSKELVSGRATVETATEDYTFEFGMYCGTRNDEFVYEEIEVVAEKLVS